MGIRNGKDVEIRGNFRCVINEEKDEEIKRSD